MDKKEKLLKTLADETRDYWCYDCSEWKFEEETDNIGKRTCKACLTSVTKNPLLANEQKR